MILQGGLFAPLLYVREPSWRAGGERAERQQDLVMVACARHNRRCPVYLFIQNDTGEFVGQRYRAKGDAVAGFLFDAVCQAVSATDNKTRLPGAFPDALK